MAQGNLSGITKKIIMLAFLVGGLSIATTGILGAIYVRNYPFHSDPCDGNIGSKTTQPTNADTCQGDGTNTNPGIIASRGYVPTPILIATNLLPSDFTDANNNLCLWDTTHEVCAETAGTNVECDDTKDSNGQLKDRNGPNDKCLQTRVPEICKQTGFVNTPAAGDETQSTLEKLADAGHNVELAFVMFLVVSVLGCLSLINIMFRLEYGYISGLTIVCKLMTDVKLLKNVLCAKKNKVDIDEDEGRFHNDHEAYSIWVVLLIHEVLIIVFGRMAIDAQELIQRECYDVTNTGVYGDGITALDFIKLTDKDAAEFEAQGNRFYTTFVVFWWITVISAAVKALGMFMAVEKTSDMDIAIPLATEILPNMCGGKSESAGSFGTGGKMNMGRRVQLRGQF